MGKRIFSLEIAEAIKQYLDNEECHYSYDEDFGAFEFDMPGSLGRFRTISCIIYVNKTSFTAYGFCPLRADRSNKEEMAAMAEFFTRANYGLKNGNFEMDYNDGEIRYKSHADCEGVLPAPSIIEKCIFFPVAMLDRYFSGIEDVLYRNVSPEEAVAKCEPD